VRDPQAFLMDEPLGAVDAEFREHMAEELRAMHDRINATTVYVTHDQLEAMQMGDKIVVMNNGVVEQFGTPQEVHDDPATLFVASFIGSPAMNLLPFVGSVSEGDSVVGLNEHRIEVPRLLQGAQGELVLGVRPEHVSLHDEGDLRGRIITNEYLGTTQIVTLDTTFGTTKARVSSQLDIAVGANVALQFKPETLKVFDKATGSALASQRNQVRA